MIIQKNPVFLVRPMLLITLVFAGLLIVVSGCKGKKQDKQVQKQFTKKDTIVVQKDTLTAGELKIIDKTKTNHTEYALTFVLNRSIYLFGKYPLKKHVLLLDNEDGKYFECNTINYSVIHEAYLYQNVVLTKLDRLPPKNDLEKFNLAKFAENANGYKIYETKEIRNQDLLKKLDTLIRGRKQIDTTFRHSDIGNSSEKIYRNELSKFSLVKLMIPGKEVMIATKFYYTKEEFSDKVKGARYGYINGKFYILTYPCSYDYLYPFSMNGLDYFESGSFCCGCGTTVVQVFQVTNNSFRLAWEDRSFSD